MCTRVCVYVRMSCVRSIMARGVVSGSSTPNCSPGPSERNEGDQIRGGTFCPHHSGGTDKGPSEDEGTGCRGQGVGPSSLFRARTSVGLDPSLGRRWCVSDETRRQRGGLWAPMVATTVSLPRHDPFVPRSRSSAARGKYLHRRCRERCRGGPTAPVARSVVY